MVQQVDLLDQPLEAREAGGIGNSGSAEEHYAALLVRMQKRVRNIGAVSDELHVSSNDRCIFFYPPQIAASGCRHA